MSTLMLTCHRTKLLVALAIFVLGFASFHPYFDASGLCGLGGCPKPAESSHAATGGANAGGHGGTSGGFSGACLAAVLAALLAAPAFVPSSARTRGARHLRPADAYLPPGTPPPRVLPSR